MSTTHADATAADLLRTIIHHRATLVSVANRILHCPHQAEDVVQDAAVKACQMTQTPALDCPLRFSSRMVRNLAIDRLRRGTLEQRHAAPLIQAEELPAPLESPHRALESRQALQSVMQALHELPPRTRIAFELNRIHDMPQNAIAASLGVSTTLVNFMIRRAQNHCLARRNEEGAMQIGANGEPRIGKEKDDRPQAIQVCAPRAARTTTAVALRTRPEQLASSAQRLS